MQTEMSGLGIVVVAIMMIIGMCIWLIAYYARQRKAEQDQPEAEVQKTKHSSDDGC